MKFSYSAQARVNRVVGYLLATACCALFAAFILCFYHGEHELFDTPTRYVSGTLHVNAAYAVVKGEENSAPYVTSYLPSEKFNDLTEEIQTLSETPIFALTSEGNYQIRLGITDYDLDRTLSWQDLSPAQPGTLALTAHGVMRLPGGTYVLYPHDPSSFSIAIDADYTASYVGRIEEFQIAPEAINDTFGAKLAGWVYFRLTELGLSVEQIYDAIGTFILGFAILIPATIATIVILDLHGYRKFRQTIPAAS